MLLIVLMGFLPWDEPVINFNQIPGYADFDDTMRRQKLSGQTFVAVHEGCMPEYIERLFLIAQAMTPQQELGTRQRAMEKSYVDKVLSRQWGVTFLLLERQATDRLFYQKLRTSEDGQHIILFTDMQKVTKNFKYIPMDADQPWQGLLVVVQFGDNQWLRFGGGG